MAAQNLWLPVRHCHWMRKVGSDALRMRRTTVTCTKMRNHLAHANSFIVEHGFLAGVKRHSYRWGISARSHRISRPWRQARDTLVPFLLGKCVRHNIFPLIIIQYLIIFHISIGLLFIPPLSVHPIFQPSHLHQFPIVHPNNYFIYLNPDPFLYNTSELHLFTSSCH